jgi:hypothetical protein
MAKEAFCHKVEEIVSRNPRRAYDKAGREIAPATMANIREQGINTLWATCQRIGCGHEAKIGVHAPTRSRRPSRVLLPTRWNRPAQGIATATTTAGQLQGPGAPSVSPTSVSAPKASAEPVPASRTRPAPEPGSGVPARATNHAEFPQPIASSLSRRSFAG